MQCQTIKVVAPKTADNPHGYIVINASDLTEDHRIFGAPEKSPPKAPKAPAKPEGD